MRKLKYIFIVAVGAVLMGCNDFLNTTSESILTDEIVFSDEATMKAVLANIYRNTEGWDRNSRNGASEGGYKAAAESNVDRNLFTSTYISFVRNEIRPTYTDVYTYIRRCNLFLQGLAKSDFFTDEVKKSYEGEARFIRAWIYWIGARYWGGMPIVPDNETWIYTPGMDMDAIAIPRSTEAATFDYLLNEMQAAADLASPKLMDAASPWSRYNKYVALAAKARIALWAASIAYHTDAAINRGTLTPANVRMASGNVGIPVTEANRYYQIALDAAEAVIHSGRYSLYQKVARDGTTDELAQNFFDAVTVKTGNTEVIWALDHSFPDWPNGTNFTENNTPFTHNYQGQGAQTSVFVNTCELFRFRDGTGPAIVQVAPLKADGSYDFKNPIVYDNVLDIWKKDKNSSDIWNDRDPRMFASVIVAGSQLNLADGQGLVHLQTGLFRKDRVSANATDETIWDGLTRQNRSAPYFQTINGHEIEAYSPNGSFPRSTENNFQRTGLHAKKWMDVKTPQASGTTTWQLRLRLADMYLIAAEAMTFGAVTSSYGETANNYFNKVRERAGLQDFTGTLTLDDIRFERNAEFTFEDSRLHDLMRWRIRHELFPTNFTTNINTDVQYARSMSLHPFRYFDPADADAYTTDRTKYKWVFYREPYYLFQGRYLMDQANYYNSFDNAVFDRNTKFTGNPNNRPDGR